MASLLLAFAGCTCGQGWRPNVMGRMRNLFHGPSNVGEPCDACDRGVAPASSGCATCGSAGSMSYGGYDGDVIGTYENTVPTVGTTYSGTTTVPYNSGTFPGAAGTRVENVRPKPAG